MTCKEYLELYQESWYRLQKSSPRLLSYEDRAMYSTWNISYLNVEKRNKSSAMLLKLWAYFDHDDLWHDLLRCTDEMGPAGYSVHRCVYAWRINVLHEQTDMDMIQLAVRCVASLVPSREDGEYWWVQQRLLQHADRCLELMTEGVKMKNSELWTYGVFGQLYSGQGRLDEAEAMYERVLQGYEKARGPEHASTLDTVNNLGSLYKSQGQLDKAEAMYKRALQGKEKAWGLEHASTLNIVNNLGSLYANQGRLDKAEAMYEQALQGKKKVWGPEHTSMLKTVNNLGNLYKIQGRLDKAEAMYKRALQGYEKGLDPSIFKTHVPALNTLENFGILHQQGSKPELAQQYYLRAQDGFRAVFGDDSKRVRTISERLKEVSA